MRRTSKPQRAYHHGSLPQALLEAAETVLKREGLTGLTLRAISREAQVSTLLPGITSPISLESLSALAGWDTCDSRTN